MGWLANALGLGKPAWDAPYEALKAQGSAFCTAIKPLVSAHYYEHQQVKVDLVFCGKDVPGAVARFNQEADLNIGPRDHSFVWAGGPDNAGKGYSPRNRYVIFLMGDDQLWDLFGLGHEMGHVSRGDRVHLKGE